MTFTTHLPSRAAGHDPSSGIRLEQAHVRATRLLGALLTVLIMLALKRHYSLASPHQLDWMLAPTAWLVARLTPAHPVFESGAGYVDFTQGIIVAPGCAGVNFMIMAFGLAAVWGLVNIKRLVPLLTWLAMALGVAYGYTLWVNAVRIALSMVLYSVDIYSGWLTAERVHRLAGIGLYVGALLIFHAGLGLAMHRFGPYIGSPKGRRLPDWMPLVWYPAGTVGVPLIHMMLRRNAPCLGEHGVTILITVASLWVVHQWVVRRRRTP